MILLSLVLVIAAAVLLVVGWFQDGLSLIYLAIGSCLLAMLLLGASVMLRRRNAPAPARRPTGPASAAAVPASADDDSATTTASRRTAVVRRPVEDTAVDHADAVADAGPDAADDPSTETTAPEEPVDPLADIRGLGPNRREALLDRFGSVEAIRDAEVAELTEVPGVSPGLARAIKNHLT
ncbi:MAG: helix-hairpin-helix domain-containing protein [Egicoccus sp.]